MADTQPTAPTPSRATAAPFEVLCERLFNATRHDGSWRWSELSDDEAAAVRASVRAALDEHLGGLCADLLERSAAQLLARPGRPYGDRMSDAAARLLEDLAAALRGGPQT